MARDENGSQAAAEAEHVSIEDMDVVPGEPIIGTEEQLSFDLGSEYNLSQSTLKLSTGSIPHLQVEGQFREGDRVRVILEIEVEYISFPPVKDRGFRVGTERRHHGLVLSAEPVE